MVRALVLAGMWLRWLVCRGPRCVMIAGCGVHCVLFQGRWVDAGLETGEYTGIMRAGGLAGGRAESRAHGDAEAAVAVAARTCT